MVVFTDFLAASSAVAGGAYGSGAAPLSVAAQPAETLTTEREGWYPAFHGAEILATKDNLAINSLCLPVFATQLSLLHANAIGEAAAAEQAVRSVAARKASAGNGSRVAGATGKRGGKKIVRAGRDSSSGGGIKFEPPPPPAPLPEVEPEMYVSRSGRTTVKTSYSDLIKDQFDEAELPERKQRRTAETGGGHARSGNYSNSFAALAGQYTVWDKLVVTNNYGLQLSLVLSLDARGVVRSIDLSLPPPDVVGLGALRPGDRLVNPVAQLDSGERLVFQREKTVQIKKIHGLQGDVIHPVKLYEAVADLGGFQAVLEKRQWQAVRNKLELNNTTSSGASLKQAYINYFA